MKLIVVSLFIFSSSCVFAKAQLINCLWQPTAYGREMLIPSVDTNCKNAVQKYVDAVNADADLRSMMNGAPLVVPASSKYSVFKAQTFSVRPQFIIIANEFAQMMDPTEFILTNTTTKLKKLGADFLILPVAADIALNSVQSLQFRQTVAQSFDAMFSQGGQDINPALYQQKVTTTILSDIHPTRDSHESQFIADYMTYGKGVFYGICRGHQLAGVILGQKLYQDLYTADQYTPVRTTTPHTGGAWHPITLNPKSILIKWTNPETMNGKPTLWVKSFHHQAIAYPLSPSAKNLTVTGFEQDQPNNESRKIVEVLESADGKYITMQFHPEAMDDDLHDNGTKILKGMVNHALDLRTK